MVQHKFKNRLCSLWQIEASASASLDAAGEVRAQLESAVEDLADQVQELFVA